MTLGCDGEGTGGLVGFMWRTGLDHPVALLGLLARAMLTQGKPPPPADTVYETEEDIRNAMAAAGMNYDDYFQELPPYMKEIMSSPNPYLELKDKAAKLTNGQAPPDGDKGQES